MSSLLRRLTQFRKKPRKESDMPLSVVLLQKRFAQIDESDLRTAAELGWKKPFDGQADPMYFVSGSGPALMLKAGPYVINIIQADSPYLGAPEEIAKQLPRMEQRRAWTEHVAWLGIDLWNADVPKQQGYGVLSQLAIHLMSINCCGVYLPGDAVFMPNDGAAEEGLYLMLRHQFHL
jgi:hypothetical protein